MNRVEYVVKQTKLNQDRTASVPDEVFNLGHDAIKEWLYEKGYIDGALDYAETETKVELIYKK